MSKLEVFDVMRKLFIYVAYPAVIVTAFLVIVARMRTLFTEYDGSRMVQWRLAVAGLLPVAVLTFAVVGELPDPTEWMPTASQWKVQFVVGALLAIGSLEASLQVSGTKMALSFMLYLSTLGTGLLYVVMEGELARFQPAVFAIVVAGGLYFVFRERETPGDGSEKLLEGEGEDEPRHKWDRLPGLGHAKGRFKTSSVR
jgi:hypothetical protein